MIIISGAKLQKRNQIPKICNKLFPRFAIWRLFLLLARNLPCCREITIVSAGIDRWQWKYLWFSRRRKTSVWEFWGEVVVVFHFLNLAVALEQVLAENVCREILILIWYTYDVGEDVSALILICLSCSGIRFFFQPHQRERVQHVGKLSFLLTLGQLRASCIASWHQAKGCYHGKLNRLGHSAFGN